MSIDEEIKDLDAQFRDLDTTHGDKETLIFALQYAKEKLERARDNFDTLDAKADNLFRVTAILLASVIAAYKVLGVDLANEWAIYPACAGVILLIGSLVFTLLVQMPRAIATVSSVKEILHHHQKPWAYMQGKIAIIYQVASLRISFQNGQKSRLCKISTCCLACGGIFLMISILSLP